MRHIKLARVRTLLKKFVRAPAFYTALLFVWFLGTATPARAIPVFANGQGGVRCGLCHTAVPDLNSYGRYVLMTNFSRGLNKHLQVMQNRSLPVALEATANASSVSRTSRLSSFESRSSVSKMSSKSRCIVSLLAALRARPMPAAYRKSGIDRPAV